MKEFVVLGIRYGRAVEDEIIVRRLLEDLSQLESATGNRGGQRSEVRGQSQQDMQFAVE
ncbi:MAG: hypothetical protein ACT4P6_04100 [Gemmatimonadaceae bacterium]